MNFTKLMPTRVDLLIEMYKNTDSRHFFDKDTMRFFKSRILWDFKRLDDKTALFKTSEKFDKKALIDQGVKFLDDAENASLASVIDSFKIIESEI